MTTDLCCVCKLENAVLTIQTYRSGLSRNDLNAETPGLVHGPPREVSATQSAGEPEVVIDAAGHAGLAARGFALDHYRSHAFTCSVNCSRESCWTAADDCQIIEIFGSASFEPGMLGNLRQRGLSQT